MRRDEGGVKKSIQKTTVIIQYGNTGLNKRPLRRRGLNRRNI